MGVPDEVMNAACCWAVETGSWPQWFIDLKRGARTGAVPSVTRAGIAAYRAAIRRQIELDPGLRARRDELSELISYFARC